MYRRIALFAALLTSTLSAQFSGLSSTANGSSIYFATTLFLRGTPRLLNGKIFVATQNGVSLFRAHEPSNPPADAQPCTSGGFVGYVGAETSAAGVVALSYRANSTDDGCSHPINTLMTELVTDSGATSLPGIVRLSANGPYALVYVATTGRLRTSFVLSFLDLRTGVQTPVTVPVPAFPEYVQAPYGGGRVIADDGTVLLAVTDGSYTRHGYILKPGADAASFPIADGMPLIIDAAASKVLYQKQDGVYLLDLGTLQSTLLVPADQPAYGFQMSDDARRLLFLRDGQVHVLDTATVMDHALTSDAAKITEAAISGDGKAVFAVTGIGRLLKIDADTGSQIELIGRTPYLNSFGVYVVPGLTLTLTGSGLSDSTINGTVPLNDWLGNVTMWIGERKVPVTQLTPDSVSIIVPWDIQSDGGSIRIQAEAPGDHTPFYFPEVIASLYPDPFPRAGAIARQDWTRTYVGPINTGEIIHVYAVGFGPVFPEVPDGAAEPSAEPFSRITQSLTCSNAEILYAGLSPGTVERVYQLDIRIGATPGYQKFTCALGGAAPFIFLTLNIVQ